MQPAPSTPERFAIVEQMGHVRFGARCTETTLAGAAMLRCEVLAPVGDGVLVVRLVRGESLYAFTECDEQQARKANSNRYGLSAVVPSLPSGTIDGDPFANELPTPSPRAENDNATPRESLPGLSESLLDRNEYSADEPPDMDATLETLTLAGVLPTDELEAVAATAIDHWYPSERYEAWLWAATEYLASLPGSGVQRVTKPEQVAELEAVLAQHKHPSAES